MPGGRNPASRCAVVALRPGEVVVEQQVERRRPGEIQHRAVHSFGSGQAAMFDLLLDHDFGWDDGLICGGKVIGLILPNAAAAGADFWAELAQRKTTFNWGVTKEFAIARAENSALRTPHSALLYQETITPPCALWIAGAGH